MSSRSRLLVLVAAGVLLALGVVLEAVGVGRVRVGGLLENPERDGLVAGGFAGDGCWSSMVVEVASGGRRRRHSLGFGADGVSGGATGDAGGGCVVLPRVDRGPRSPGRWFGVAAILVWRFANQPDILAWFRPAIWLAVLRLWAVTPGDRRWPGGPGGCGRGRSACSTPTTLANASS